MNWCYHSMPRGGYQHSKHSSWWGRLEDVFRLRLQKTPWRRLDQDEYIHLSHSSSEDVFKTSWSKPYIHLRHTSSRRFQDVFKTFRRRLQDVLRKRLQGIFKTSSRHLQDVLPRRLQDIFKTSSRRLARMPSRCFEDVSSG